MCIASSNSIKNMESDSIFFHVFGNDFPQSNSEVITIGLPVQSGGSNRSPTVTQDYLGKGPFSG